MTPQRHQWERTTPKNGYLNEVQYAPQSAGVAERLHRKEKERGEDNAEG